MKMFLIIFMIILFVGVAQKNDKIVKMHYFSVDEIVQVAILPENTVLVLSCIADKRVKLEEKVLHKRHTIACPALWVCDRYPSGFT